MNRRSLTWLALGGLLLSIATHIAVIAGYDLRENSPVSWAAFLGIFVIVFSLIRIARREPGRKPVKVIWYKAYPRWVTNVTAVLSIYFLVNFLVAEQIAGPGDPARSGDKFVLTSHGRTIREITAAEYAAVRSWQTRGLSAIWMLVYFCSFCFLVVQRKEPELVA